jgi:hypothetical protein
MSHIPGNKLPGYLHLVPSGQTSDSFLHFRSHITSHGPIEDSLSDEAQALRSRPPKPASQARHAPQAACWRSRKDDYEEIPSRSRHFQKRSGAPIVHQ